MLSLTNLLIAPSCKKYCDVILKRPFLKIKDTLNIIAFLLFVANLSKDEDDNNFLKELEKAIGTPPSAKRRCSEEITSIPSIKAAENGEKKEEKLNGLVSAVNNSKHSADDELLNSPPIDSTTEIYDDKMENDLLKDLDDDHDLASVYEEVENLMESVLGDVANVKEPEDVGEAEEDEEDKTETDKKSEMEVEDLDENEETKMEEEEMDSDKKDNVEDKPVENKPKEVEKLLDDIATKSPTQGESKEAPKNQVEDSLENEIASKVASKESSEDKESETKNDDVACESSETSSSVGDTPEDSSDCDKQITESTPEDSSDCDKQITESGSSNDDKNEPSQVESKETTNIEAMDVDEDEQMDVDEAITIGELVPPSLEDSKTADNGEEEQLCMVREEPKSSEEEPTAEEITSSSTKEFIPLKLSFMRKFTTAVGKLSRAELEQLLIVKITESIMFCSENTDIRSRLEKQEKISEAYKKRLDNIKKQFNDLEMIHNRVMKDLKDRPEAPITPVKITRAVGLQVYQPQSRSKFTAPPSLPNSLKTVKRPIESEPVVNGKGLSPDTKRKKTLKTTPLRPPLSDIQRKSLELEEAKVEQNLRKNVISSISPAILSSVTMTPVNVINGNSKKSVTSQSIDLTDDTDETSSGAKFASQQVPQPPALVAIQRAQSQQQNHRQTITVPQTVMSSTSNTIRMFHHRSKNN